MTTIGRYGREKKKKRSRKPRKDEKEKKNTQKARQNQLQRLARRNATHRNDEYSKTIRAQLTLSECTTVPLGGCAVRIF